MKRLVLLVAALLAALALAGVLRVPEFARANSGAAPAADVLVVNGVGSVKSVPDEAQLSFGVDSRGTTAKDALAANGEVMQRVIRALRDAGARDLATQYVSVWPISGEAGSISGYSASNSVSATIGVAQAGDLIDAATAAGANDVSGPELSPSDADRLQRQALSAALADARSQAEVLAKAAGRSLGKITAISEAAAQSVPLYGSVTATADAATPIVPGKQETSARVSVTFELQ